MTEQSRRSLLRLGGLAAAGVFTGCLDRNPDEGEMDADPPTARATRTERPPAETFEAVGTTGRRPAATPSGDDLRQRMDQRGGPTDLQSDPVVAAIDIEGDAGPAPYIFTPTVLWAETGATVTWDVDGGAHAIAAYHPDNGRTLRIPEDAPSFVSGRLDVGDTFSHTFETPGVYNYFCQPHEYHGMVGVVVVGEALAGPGTVDGSNLQVEVAGEHLERLLALADIETTPPTTDSPGPTSTVSSTATTTAPSTTERR
ncbi:cupredoxin domain-containing protein [Halomarina rubra]|uniref:Plastocyanin/azurin family copper-binding protein n=1 Tax=Halomarina rubra TaxID=2071873 RepID=A0ABD6B0T9_9EURY|nr:plastocyanin/azurin family copper-binding protein [Halomarina rubra]